MDKVHFHQHISREYNDELERVREDLLTMGRLARGLLADSLEALLTQDAKRARTLDAADNAIDELELIIDEECQRIIARRQPAAIDLRLILSIFKNSTDLERMGDEAQKLARMAVRRADDGRSPLGQRDALQTLGNDVLAMVDGTVRALETLDAELAFELYQDDEAIDAAYKALVTECVQRMSQAPEDVLDVVAAARVMERIGDHACNICEQLIYLLGGEDVRHQPLADIAAAVRKAGQRES